MRSRQWWHIFELRWKHSEQLYMFVCVTSFQQLVVLSLINSLLSNEGLTCLLGIFVCTLFLLSFLKPMRHQHLCKTICIKHPLLHNQRRFISMYMFDGH